MFTATDLVIRIDVHVEMLFHYLTERQGYLINHLKFIVKYRVTILLFKIVVIKNDYALILIYDLFL